MCISDKCDKRSSLVTMWIDRKKKQVWCRIKPIGNLQLSVCIDMNDECLNVKAVLGFA